MTAKKNHIRNNLILLFVVLIAIPLLVLGFQSYNKSKQILEKNLVTNSESLTKEISTNIRTQLKFYEKNLMLMSQNPYIRDINNPESFPFAMQSLETLKNTFENIEFAYVGTKEKGMYQKPDWEPPSDYDPTSRPWYQNAVSKDGIAWTDPYLDTETNELVISCSTPIKKNGALVGVISIDLTLEDMANYIINSKIGENGYIFMMDSNLNFMAHQDSSLIGEALDIPKLRDAINASESGALEYTYKVDGKDDKRIATFIEIPGFNWIVASSVSKSEINKDTSFILNNTLTIGIISLIVALVVSIMYSISLTRPIQKLLSSLELVKKGDLTAKTDIKVKNEIGDLADSFNIMLENVSSLIRNANAVSESVEDASSSLAETSHSTSQASMEVTKTVEDIATGAGNQAEDAETCVQLASNLDSQFKDLIANNTEMVDLAKVIMEMNQNGINSVSTLDQKSSDNKLSIERIENAISELQEKSKHIGNILVTITSIADQTNLLALNASIEAARAGEHGRGFAVVADEIRKLAVESNSSADKINNIVVQIQKDTENTAVIMDEVLVSNREQEEAVDSVGKSFGEISSSITQMNSKIDMINNFVLNMDDSKNSIMESIESISAVSEETAAASEEVTASMEEQSASVEELASAAEQLKGLSESLNMEISKFKI